MWLMKKSFAKSFVSNTNNCTCLFHITIERYLKLFVKLKQLLPTSVKEEIVIDLTQ